MTVCQKHRFDNPDIFKLILHLIADADTDENYIGIHFPSRYRDSCSLQPRGGSIGDKSHLGHNF